ncbi:hypothetical protein BCON_0286g00110 [Botryotinia convoluta]|uniref:Uncharacterized protein n=1 Tax=Botryotinia convoluta TaxID=54673 RepID=A0A4Z1HDK0_9HELO|nr:hypothetical protein BCON_0286g00110 [Botryotinia convoluta]
MSLTAVPNDSRKFPKAKILDCVDLQALRIFPKEKRVDTMSYSKRTKKGLLRLLFEQKEEAKKVPSEV